MQDVLFYDNYQTPGDVLAIVICIAIFMLLNSAYAAKRKNLIVFKIAIALCIIASTASISYHSLVKYISPETVWAIYATRAICYIGLMWIYVCFFIYVRNLVGMRTVFSNVMRVSIIGVACLASVWVLLTPVTKLGFFY